MELFTQTLATVASDPFIIAKSITNFLGDIKKVIGVGLLFVFSIMSIVFIFKRRFMELLTFIVLGIIIFAIFYAPEMFANLGKNFGNANKNLTFN